VITLKWKQTSFILAALLIAIVFATRNVQPVLAGGATVLHVDVSFLGDPPNHPCTGGTLEANGRITVVMHPTGQGYFVHIGGGQGGVTMTDVDTGEVYRFVGAFNDHTLGSGGGTTVHHLSFIGPGPDGNFVGQFVEHVTITPNGDMTASFDWGNASCQ
jgi:hypothetical protein